MTKLGTSAGKRSAFRCLMSGEPIGYEYIRKEAQAGRMKSKLMAIIVQGKGERLYLSPNAEQESAANIREPYWKPELDLSDNKRDLAAAKYGIKKFSDLFTNRQLTGLTTFSDLIEDLREKIKKDISALPQNNLVNSEGQAISSENYSDMVSLYLGFVIDKCSDYWSTICSWHLSKELIRNTFSRQSISITWDFVEVNPFSDSSGSWSAMTNWVWKSLSNTPAFGKGYASQKDASTQNLSENTYAGTLIFGGIFLGGGCYFDRSKIN